MFDSDNIPLITRVESKEGVVTNFAVNSEGEGIYTVTIDSDYVSKLINKALVFNQQDMSVFVEQIEEVRGLLGIEVGIAPVETEADSENFISVSYTQTPEKLAGSMSFKWRLNSFDGGELASREITISSGTTALNVINSLLYTILKNESAMKYLYYNTTDPLDSNNIRIDDASKLVIRFKEAYKNFDFTITNTTNTIAADGSSFKVVQK